MAKKKRRKPASWAAGFSLPGAPSPLVVGRTIVGCLLRLEVNRLTKADCNVIRGFAGGVFNKQANIKQIEFCLVFNNRGRLRVAAMAPLTPGAKPMKNAKKATPGADGNLICYRIKGGFRQFRANDAVGLRARCSKALVTVANARKLGLRIP